MAIFDAPDRSFSSVGRANTNTPLQALVTMNDTQFVEAARRLARRVLTDAELRDDRAKLADVLRRCTGRPLASADEELLRAGLDAWRRRFSDHPEHAARLLASAGESARSPDLDDGEHAAWLMLATTILNLDATLVVD